MSEQPKPKDYQDLLKQGMAAYKANKPRTAHDLWREAATINPYDEQVWQALLRVAKNDADRRVCLENVLQLNPLNAQARQLMDKLESKQKAQARANDKKGKKSPQPASARVELADLEDSPAPVPKRKRYTFWRMLFFGVLVGLLAIGIAVGIILMIQSGKLGGVG
jgi:DNA-binding SARP family transcriptional activator